MAGHAQALGDLARAHTTRTRPPVDPGIAPIRAACSRPRRPGRLGQWQLPDGETLAHSWIDLLQLAAGVHGKGKQPQLLARDAHCAHASLGRVQQRCQADVTHLPRSQRPPLPDASGAAGTRRGACARQGQIRYQGGWIGQVAAAGAPVAPVDLRGIQQLGQQRTANCAPCCRDHLCSSAGPAADFRCRPWRRRWRDGVRGRAQQAAGKAAPKHALRRCCPLPIAKS